MYKELKVYQMAFSQAMRIFVVSKSFPKEERYSLTDQIRRSSRSVCSNIGEAYRKRQYKAHFISKLSDSDMENTETQIWLDFALRCGYLSNDEHRNIYQNTKEIGRLLYFMIKAPEKFLPSNAK
ncbi:MAG: diversity-generating retroelement protein bAvd family protein [Bacteroidetes bacterium]|nr:MAG: diversity-generating retroelement protein bAvd family protein [Bacteroidota bacterium]